jgi:hypothetical protein
MTNFKTRYCRLIDIHVMWWLETGDGQWAMGMGDGGTGDVWVMPQITYIYRVQSSVWRLPNYWPLTPSPPKRVILPLHRRRGGGTHSPGGEGVGGNISEDARHWIGLLQYNPSTGYTHRMSWFTCAELWLTAPIYYQWLKGCTLYCTKCTCVMFCGSEIFSNH